MARSVSAHDFLSVHFELSIKSQNVTVAQPMGQHLSASGYAALLPTIWSLLSDARDGRRMEQEDVTLRRRQVWDAVLDHGSRASTTSAVKKLVVEFIGRVYVVSCIMPKTGLSGLPLR